MLLRQIEVPDLVSAIPIKLYSFAAGEPVGLFTTDDLDQARKARKPGRNMRGQIEQTLTVRYGFDRIRDNDGSFAGKRRVASDVRNESAGRIHPQVAIKCARDLGLGGIDEQRLALRVRAANESSGRADPVGRVVIEEYLRQFDRLTELAGALQKIMSEQRDGPSGGPFVGTRFPCRAGNVQVCPSEFFRETGKETGR